MTSEHLKAVCSRLVERCRSGNSWPPDLAEFIALSSECAGGAFGLIVADVTSEYNRWRNKGYQYGSAEEFPWRQDVLYHICTELKRLNFERKLTPAEFEKAALRLLAKWEKHVGLGMSVPPVRKKIENATPWVDNRDPDGKHRAAGEELLKKIRARNQGN